MSEKSEEFRNHIEDEVKKIVDEWSDVKCAVAYWYLRNSRGCSMESIEHRIDEMSKQAFNRSL